MPTDTQRLRRLLADELGACGDADVAARLDDLESLSRAVPADLEDDLAAAKALGDDTRHRLARLVAAADRDLCVCELNPLVEVSDSAVSHALSDLAAAGLVEREKRGTWRYYRATPRAEALLDALDHTQDPDA